MGEDIDINWCGCCQEVPGKISLNIAGNTWNVMKEEPPPKKHIATLKLHRLQTVPPKYKKYWSDGTEDKKYCCPVIEYSRTKHPSPCYCDCSSKSNKKKVPKYGDYGTDGYLCSQVCDVFPEKRDESEDKGKGRPCCLSCCNKKNKSKAVFTAQDHENYKEKERPCCLSCCSKKKHRLIMQDHEKYEKKERSCSLSCCSKIRGKDEYQKESIMSSHNQKKYLKEPKWNLCESCNMPCTKARKCDSRRTSYQPFPSCPFRAEGEIIPSKKGLIIPNYMGYVPGMKFYFGDSFGVTGSNILYQHFVKNMRN